MSLRNISMKRQANSNTIWLVLFAIGGALDTIGLALPEPIWLRFGLLALGILSLLAGIVLVGRLQRSE